MADNGLILVTGAAGQLGAVGRTVTGLLLDRGLSRASITAPATLWPSGLTHCPMRRTERRRGDVDCPQDRGKHRPRFLTEKSLRCGCAVYTREKKVVNRRQTFTLSRAI
jgi:hypothetical protein